MTSGELQIKVSNHVQVADYHRGETFGPRQLPSHELVWLLRGSAEMTTEMLGSDGRPLRRETHRLEPGTVALLRRGEWDRYVWATDRVSRHAYVHFQLLDPGHLGPPDTWATCHTVAGIPVLEGLCHYLTELAGLQDAHSQQRGAELVRLLLDLLITGPWPADPDHHPVVALVCRHVAACWATAGVSRVPVAELARAAHVSAGHLHRTFRQAFGCGPARALELVRLARAATALQRSNTTISDVAAAHGFANPYHFSRRFAHTYGSPPHAFRTREPLTDPMWPLRETQLLAVAAPLLSQVNDLPHPM